MERVFITTVMTGCIIRVAIVNVMVLIMVLIMVIKDIKLVRSGDSLLRPSAPVLHHSRPSVLLLVRWLLLYKHGRRYVPSVYKWSLRRLLFGW